MKLFPIILLAAMIPTALCGCGNNDIEETASDTVYSESSAAEDAVVSNPADSVITEIISADSTSAKIKVENGLDVPIALNYPFKIQMLKDDRWIDVPYTAGFEGFVGHGYSAERNSSEEFDMVWSGYYGALGAGNYRIKNEFGIQNKYGRFDFYYSFSEFEIT